MRNKKFLGAVAAVIAILLAGVGWWWNSKSAQQEQGANKSGQVAGKPDSGRKQDAVRPTSVLVAKIKSGNVRVVQTSIGNVIPSSILTLRSRINGQLVRVLFKEGQTVRAGELLAEIDPRPFQAQLTQVEGQALHDQALLKNAQLDYERYKTLLAQDSIALQQVDAQAALIQQYQGTVLTDRGLVDNAKLQLEFTRITSPISGRIGLRQIDVGNNIATTDTLAVINAISPIQVAFTLPEDRVSSLIKRQHETRLPVEAWDRSNTTLLAKGELLSVDNQIDVTSGTIKLKAQFSNNDAALFPNQFVNIHLLSDTLRDVVVAPRAAIQHGSVGDFVYLIANDGQDKKVTVRPVVLGAADGESIAINKGLSADDEVVISGIDRLREGARVAVSSNDEHNDKPGARGGIRSEGTKLSENAGSDPGKLPVHATGDKPHNHAERQPQS